MGKENIFTPVSSLGKVWCGTPANTFLANLGIARSLSLN